MYFLEEEKPKEPGKVRAAMGKGAHAVYKGVNSKAGRITSGAVGGLGAAGAAGAVVRIKQLEKKLAKTVNPAKRKKIAKEISMLKKVAIAGGAVGAVGGGVAAGGVKAANKGITHLRNRKYIQNGKRAVAAQPGAVTAGGSYKNGGDSTYNMTASTAGSGDYIELEEAYMMGYYDALDEDYLDYDAIEQAYLEGYYGQLAEMGYYDEDYDDYDDYEDDYDEDDAYLEGYYTALEELDLV